MKDPVIDPNEVPEVVPEKIKSPYNFKIFIIIAAIVISFHVLINFAISEENSDSIASVFSFLNPLIVSVIGFSIAIRYRKSLIFGKSYIA